MDRSDFLKKLDQELKKKQQEKQKDNSREQQLEEIAKRICAEAKPVMESYKAELEKRGISVDMTFGDCYLSFKIRYPDGGYTGFEFCRRNSGIGYHFRSCFADKDKSYTGEGGDMPNAQEGWKVADLERIIQRCVEDYSLGELGVPTTTLMAWDRPANPANPQDPARGPQ